MVYCETRERVKAIRKGKNSRKDRKRGSGQPFLKFTLFSGFTLATNKKRTGEFMYCVFMAFDIDKIQFRVTEYEIRNLKANF